MASVFISYSHNDEDLRHELEKHLSGLCRQGVISTWHDSRIVPGQEIDSHISAEMDAADIILLLVSADFLASDYCYDIEMILAMDKHEKGTAHVIPVILRPCDWHDAPFGKLKAVPNDGKPIVKYATFDDGFLEVAHGVRNADWFYSGSPIVQNLYKYVESLQRAKNSPCRCRGANRRAFLDFLLHV